LATITAGMAERQAFLPGKRVKLDFGEDGLIMLDGVAGEASNVDGPADATIGISLDNFLAMAEGRLSGAMAYMQGKLKISGDMATAMQFQSVTSKLRR
jgi:putative sterol carrier protein